MDRRQRRGTSLIGVPGVLVLLGAACGSGVPGAPSTGGFDAAAPEAAVDVAAPPVDAVAPRVRLWLRFSGATIVRGDRDDAAADRSSVCGATVPAFAHEPFGSDRDEVLGQLRAAVGELFAGFALDITDRQPAAGPYHMVVLGGRPALCGLADGLAGLAPLDCGNRSAVDVAFVFTEQLTAIEIVALATAHETGHMLGLPHTLEPCDVMSNFMCTGDSKRFLDEEMAVAPEHRGGCGLDTASSHDLLVAALGSGEPDAAGP